MQQVFQYQSHVIDANGNYRNIGTVTSDSSGAFSFQWKPDIEGKYTVIATFAGSKAYYPSFVESSFSADSVAATPASQQTQPESIADLYFVPAVVGLFVAIIVVGLLIILMIRKRP